MISEKLHDHALIKIDRLMAINVKVDSTKNEDQLSPQSL